jgi:hypothetical protein
MRWTQEDKEIGISRAQDHPAVQAVQRELTEARARLAAADMEHFRLFHAQSDADRVLATEASLNLPDAVRRVHLARLEVEKIARRHELAMEEAKATAKAYWLAQVQQAARELIDELRGRPFAANQRVRHLVEQAGANGVRLSPLHLISLDQEHLEFWSQTVRRECGLPPES